MLLNFLAWAAAVVTTSCLAGVLARGCGWSAKKRRDAAIFVSAGVACVWGLLAFYGLHIRNPYAWPVQGWGVPANMAMLALWIAATRFLAPRVADRVCTSGVVAKRTA
jgi:hypothetical protein